MELFLPSILVFLLALFLTFLIAPHATPLVAAVLSIVFLTYGIYDHYQMFEVEYRLSTWQEGLKIYAPAIMIAAVLLFVLMGIAAFFTSGKVPVPSMPAMEIPTMSQMGNSMSSIASSTLNSIENVTANVMNNANNALNSVMSVSRGNNKGNRGQNLSRSFLETI